MSTIEGRKIAAVLGAFVADAAAQPLHWMYNVDELRQLTGPKADVEFHNPPGNPFYRITTGHNSCYGDQAYVLLKSLLDHKGYVRGHYAESTYKFFGSDSAYSVSSEGKKQQEDLYRRHGPTAPGSLYCETRKEEAMAVEKDAKPETACNEVVSNTDPEAMATEHAEETQTPEEGQSEAQPCNEQKIEQPEKDEKAVGEKETESQGPPPISGPWKHECLKHFETNYTAGKEQTGSETDIALDCVAKIVPLVALYAGKTELLECVEDCVSVTQQSDIVIAVALAAARLLEHVILYGKVDGAIDQVITALRDPKRLNPTDLDLGLAAKLQEVDDLRLDKHIRVARDNFRIS